MAKEIQFILYNLPDNSGTVQAIVQDETIFLTQKAMGELFGVEVNTINYHLKEIFSSGELIDEATIRKIRIVQTEGNRQVERERAFYNLDAIISVGYRVNSQRATLFRQWASRVLNEFIRKGFVLDDDRLKQGNAVFGRDYFRELLERVVLFVQANVAFGNKSPTSMPNVALIMTVLLRLPKSFMQWCRIVFIMPSQGILPLKSFIPVPTTPSLTWDWQHGRMHPKDVF